MLSSPSLCLKWLFTAWRFIECARWFRCCLWLWLCLWLKLKLKLKLGPGLGRGLSCCVCSLALGIECLFIFKHHKKYSIRPKDQGLGTGYRVLRTEKIYTLQHTFNNIFVSWQKQLQFLRHFVLCQAETKCNLWSGNFVYCPCTPLLLLLLPLLLSLLLLFNEAFAVK